MEKHLPTITLLLLATGLAGWKFWDYLHNPWTRDGMVRAYVIQVTPRVSGPIVELSISDNQVVEAGDLLFRIDPRTFSEQLRKASAEETRTKGDYDRAIELVRRGDISQRDFDAATAAYEIAVAESEAARLDLEFTEVRAPVRGYITNLNVRVGSQAVTNQPVMALVDSSSFWIDGFFRETVLASIKPGNKASAKLMTYPGVTLTGTVKSIDWGIAQQDGSTSHDLLPVINPSFEWIRLAQRVPVRIELDPLPDNIKLRVGTTASVLVQTGD